LRRQKRENKSWWLPCDSIPTAEHNEEEGDYNDYMSSEREKNPKITREKDTILGLTNSI